MQSRAEQNRQSKQAKRKDRQDHKSRTKQAKCSTAQLCCANPQIATQHDKAEADEEERSKAVKASPWPW